MSSCDALGLRHAVKAGLEVEQFARGEEGIDVEFLRHHPDCGAGRPRLPVDVAAPDPRFAAGLVDQTSQDIDQRRFAGPVGTEQAEQRPARDREVDAFQRFLGRRPARRLGCSLVSPRTSTAWAGKGVVAMAGVGAGAEVGAVEWRSSSTGSSRQGIPARLLPCGQALAAATADGEMLQQSR